MSHEDSCSFPFLQVRLRDLLEQREQDEPNVAAVENKVEGVVRDAIDEAENLTSGNDRQPKKPLIRINVEYENDQHTFNTVRFGHRFVGLIANPEDVVKLNRVRPKAKYDDDELDGVLKGLQVLHLLKKIFRILKLEYNTKFTVSTS